MKVSAFHAELPCSVGIRSKFLSPSSQTSVIVGCAVNSSVIQ